MSVRALSALDKIGLGKHVSQEYGIPMRARMIHNLDRTTYPGDCFAQLPTYENLIPLKRLCASFVLTFPIKMTSYISVPYGRKDQCIYSVGRRYVNEILLNGKPTIITY